MADTFDAGTMKLHWQNTPRRGLGNLLKKVNHIALVVSDVGRSLYFYSDILGFQQIRRPNFDRHGAWLTMGNVELHLILGNPIVHSGDDLIVSHISLETDNIGKVLEMLEELEIPFATNKSVPKGDEAKGIVTQFFLRDPDGYYIELCNCDILTEFCLGDGKLGDCYNEGVKHTTHMEFPAKLIALAEHAKKEAKKLNEKDPNAILREFDQVDGSNVVVDETKLENLLKRTKIYGDLVQGENEESLRKILQKTNNDIPSAIQYICAKHRGSQTFQPPTIFKNNNEAYKPPTLHIDHHKNVNDS